jgi:acetyl esterase
MTQLHPQIREVLRVTAEAGLRPIEEMTPAEAREQMEATARARKAEPLRIAKIEERLVPGPGGAIRLRLYWPLQSAAPMPAIVYFHGGGHVIGSLDTHDFVARNLCAGTGAMVASVDYRMGPEHKFPAAVDDCFTALQWVHANAASLGIDPDRIGVHGDSAGGNLAAVAALLARDAGGPQLRLQSLVYPVTDYGLAGDSYDKYASGYGILTRQAMVWFRDHYLRRPETRATGALRRSAPPTSREWRRQLSLPRNTTYCTMMASVTPMPCGMPACRSSTRSFPV